MAWDPMEGRKRERERGRSAVSFQKRKLRRKVAVVGREARREREVAYNGGASERLS